MNPKRVFYIMLGVVVLCAALAIGSVVMGSSMLKSKAAELNELKLQDRLIEEQQVALIQANKDIERYQELETIAKSVVPQDKDQARTVREIITLADQSGIKINSITFPASTLGQRPPAAAPSTTEGSTQTPVVQTPNISQVTPVSGIAGLYQLEMTVSVNEVAPTYNQLIDFLSRLEQNRRTAQVTTISINPSSINRNLVEFNLTMNVFVKP